MWKTILAIVVFAVLFTAGLTMVLLPQKRIVTMELYAGDTLVMRDSFVGELHTFSTGGAYYHKGDSLIEVHGTFIFKSVKQ